MRLTPRRLVFFAALVALWCVYLMYFTSEKRIVRHHLSGADTKSEAAIHARLKPLSDLFAKGRKGAKAFAAEALSWDGKWEFVKGMVSGDEFHGRYMAESFARHVFSPDELRLAMESMVKNYLDDIDGLEGEMLVSLRVDLADPDRPAELVPVQLRNDEEFRKEYLKLSALVMGEVRADVGVTVGREVGMLIASEVATQAALQAMKAAAAELGVNAGILGTGAATSVVTLGVGMIIAIILDYLLDEIFKIAGYDPAAKIEDLVCESMNKLEASLSRDAGTYSSDKKGALRLRMEEIHEARSKLRREAVERLVKEGGMR